MLSSLIAFIVIVPTCFGVVLIGAHMAVNQTTGVCPQRRSRS